MSGVIADTLAAHQLRLRLPLHGAECSNAACTQYYTGGPTGIARHHAAHRPDVHVVSGACDPSNDSSLTRPLEACDV